MRIGVLKTGGPPPGVAAASYPDMVAAALGDGYDCRELDVTRNELPATHAVDAYVITGSAASAYDSEPWIGQLQTWLQALPPALPIVGICFGHQMLAQAHGGKVQRSNRGWGLGLHEYRLVHDEPWTSHIDSIVLPVSHADQVVTLPPAARIVATSDFCPFAILSYTDRKAISVQAHPEFSLSYTRALIELRRQRCIIDEPSAQRFLASLERVHDCALVMSWIRRFLES